MDKISKAVSVNREAIDYLTRSLSMANREEAMARSKGWDDIADDWKSLKRGYALKLVEAQGVLHG